MRALFLHASTDLYGSDLAALEVARVARERGWEVTFTVPGPGPLIDHVTATGATVVELDPLKPRRADLRLRALAGTTVTWARNARRVRALGLAERFDVVYSTTAPTLAGFGLARRWSARHVYHVHEIFWFPQLLVRAFERVLARSDVVVCCSFAVAEQFRHPVVRSRSIVVPTGADVPADTPTRTPLVADPARLVCVARLNEWKGQEVLVDAVAALHRDGHPVRLSLVGGVYADQHHFREALEDRVRSAGLTEWVDLVGDLPRDETLRLVGDADVFVLPSRRPEPFGMALIEAMALGRPAIATDAGGPRDIITSGHDGVLVAPGDPAALAAAVAGYLTDRDRAREMGERARERAKAFSQRAMAEAVVGRFVVQSS